MPSITPNRPAVVSFICVIVQLIPPLVALYQSEARLLRIYMQALDRRVKGVAPERSNRSKAPYEAKANPFGKVPTLIRLQRGL